MNIQQSKSSNDFRFGIEAEYLLITIKSGKPIWYENITFDELHDVLEAIPTSDMGSFEGLKLEAPHRKLMPYVVEGYHVPDAEMNPIDILPKGVEIRTPVSTSIDGCLTSLELLFQRLAAGLSKIGLKAAAISHHPTADSFQGPQNKRRHDFWQWAMQAMVTYGPDVNISLPEPLQTKLDFKDLHAKVNYYAPALAALTLNSPFYKGSLWRFRGRPLKSLRTYRRSIVAPAIEIHPDQGGRLEFKPFEMTNDLADFRGYLLLWLALLLDDGLRGRASDQTRIYDLGQIARYGADAESIAEIAGEVLKSAPHVLRAYGFDPSALDLFDERLQTRWTPADKIIADYENGASMSDILQSLTELRCAGRTRSTPQDRREGPKNETPVSFTKPGLEYFS